MDWTPTGVESDYARLAMTIYERLVLAVRTEQSIYDAIESSQAAVYVKAADGQILHSNSTYNRLFTAREPAAGRYPHAYLHHSLHAVSEASDALILNGADQVEFVHQGCTGSGDAVVLRTFKKALSGLAGPKMAILGVSRIERYLSPVEVKRLQELADAWRVVQSWDARDREIARKLVSGERMQRVADALGVSVKTIENRRKALFESLGVKSMPEFVKILVRLQDRGFEDFGL
ncbi:MAG: hypothetical protein KatS3mg111_1365 [Pirellulaceae bacterium]|nr:MAG: hypothetical protein KatS3mg111_1365 [Pirellulaceae bacterium]